MVYKENFEVVLNRLKEIYKNAQNVKDYNIEICGSYDEATTISYRFDECINSYEEVRAE